VAYELSWAPTARQDLRELVAYIAEDDRQAAGRFARSIFQAIERLRQFPESGRMVPEFGDPAIRELVKPPCRVVYRVALHRQAVEIARVWHAARGTPQL
jgi:plasmid stabilization system protein ParE